MNSHGDPLANLPRSFGCCGFVDLARVYAMACDFDARVEKNRLGNRDKPAVPIGKTVA